MMTLISSHDIGQPAKRLQGLMITYIISRIQAVVRRGPHQTRRFVRLLLRTVSMTCDKCHQGAVCHGYVTL